MPNALEEARSGFESILKLLESDADGNHADILKEAVNGVILCLNHGGVSGNQEKLLEKVLKVNEEQRKESVFVRYVQSLEFRNRTFNDQFNDYRFEAIVNAFESEVNQYIELIGSTGDKGSFPPSGKDYLAHKMLSSLGRAYAYMSSHDPDYSDFAKDYFNESMKHFDPLCKDNRTPNALILFHWYHDQRKEALETLKKYRSDLFADEPSNEKGRPEPLPILLEKRHDCHAFDFSVLLRMAVEWSNPSVAEVGKIKKKAMDTLGKVTTHPAGVIYKWLGIAYLKNEAYREAIPLFERSVKTADGFTLNAERFTLKTIALSCQGLAKVSLDRLGEKEKADETLRQFKDSLERLIGGSRGFAGYVKARGGKEKWIDDLERHEIDSIIRWMPFDYA